MRPTHALLLLAAVVSAAQASEHKVAPGEVASLITDGSLVSQTTVKLTGAIDARDMAAFEHLPEGIVTLDLSDTEIRPLTLSDTQYFGRSYFAAGEIPCYAFFQTYVETVCLPANTTMIGDGAFAGSRIRRIVVPEGVGIIGDYAFYSCQKLEEVVLPSTLATLGKGALSECGSLKVMTMSGTRVQRLEARTFAGCASLRLVELPSSLRYIGKEAFTGTDITALDAAGVMQFDDYALSGMSRLESVVLNPEARTAGGLLMDNVSLRSLQGVPSALPEYFLANCSSFDPSGILHGVETVGRYALANHQSSEMVLGPSLSYVDAGAFHGMEWLDTIDARNLDTHIPAVAENAFTGLDRQNIWVYVTEESFDLWKAHPQWGQFNIKSDSREWLEVEKVAEVDGIAVRLDGATLEIAASDSLVSVAVYALDGRLLYQASPGVRQHDVDISRFDTDMALVMVATPSISRTVKLLLR